MLHPSEMSVTLGSFFNLCCFPSGRDCLENLNQEHCVKGVEKGGEGRGNQNLVFIKCEFDYAMLSPALLALFSYCFVQILSM